MIYSILQREDIPKLLSYSKDVHQETRYKDGEFDPSTMTQFLLLVASLPNKFFFRYSKNTSEEITGMFFGQLSPEYFSGKTIASDLGMFVRKDHRGSPTFFRMYSEFETWAKQHGAYKIVLYHSTGIEPEKTEKVFSKLGLTKYGSIFDKEF